MTTSWPTKPTWRWPSVTPLGPSESRTRKINFPITAVLKPGSRPSKGSQISKKVAKLEYLRKKYDLFDEISPNYSIKI